MTNTAFSPCLLLGTKARATEFPIAMPPPYHTGEVAAGSRAVTKSKMALNHTQVYHIDVGVCQGAGGCFRDAGRAFVQKVFYYLSSC